jgi:hypothetical protein
MDRVAAPTEKAFSVRLVQRARSSVMTFKTRSKFVHLPLDFLPHVSLSETENQTVSV